MPRGQRTDLQGLAALGAQVRIQQLEAEIAALRKQFPSEGTRSRGARTTAVPVKRKRRKMSAKARAAISAAQKARWAKQKAGKK